MNIQTAVKTCFSKYATFSGRASRSEYWFFYLFTIIASIVTWIIDTMLLGYSAEDTGAISLIFQIIIILPSIAVAFSEDKGRWVTEYPGNEFMVSNLTGLVSFRDGQFYQNNSGEINDWYDSVETSSITAVFNDSPNSDKFFKHIIQKSSSIWECTEIKNQYGQSSNLIEEDFEEFEGKWKAAFLQDENTPNINNPLLEGDDLRCHSLIVKLDNNSATDEKLFSVVVGFSSSELNN